MTNLDQRVHGAVERLERELGAKVRTSEPLAPLTTYRVGGRAAAFVEVDSVDDLEVLAAVHADTGVPMIVIGRGSNMLVADDGFNGVAISLAGLADQIELPDEQSPDEQGIAIGREGDDCEVRAGGAVALPVLARRTAAAALTGFEWAVGVPGSIGGAVRMNAGGHGSDMSNCLVSVTVFDLGGPSAESTGSNRIREIPAADVGLRFRASSLSPSLVVLTAKLSLRRGHRETAEQEIAEIVRWRRQHQPGGQNCGSVFVNPVPGEVTAGALIDAAGLRGFRIGTAWVSDKHANFIQASEGGTAADVRAVIEAVRGRVAAESGYLLRSEVRLVGFDDADPMSFDDLSHEPQGVETTAGGGLDASPSGGTTIHPLSSDGART